MMKLRKLCSILLSVTIVLSLITVALADEPAWGSDYDTVSEFTIDSKEDFLAFVAFSQVYDDEENWCLAHTFEGKTVKLTCDIDLSSTELSPIGANNYADRNGFAGVFDGQNHTIIGGTISLTEEQVNGYYPTCGLFGVLSGGTIKNLTLKDAVVEKTENYDTSANGGIVGEINGIGAVVENCHIVGCTVAGGSSVGGIAGKNGSGSVIDCTTDAASVIMGRTSVGGVVGNNVETVSGCVNYGTVRPAEGTQPSSQTGSFGGIAGSCSQMSTIELTDCTNYGDVLAPGYTNVGGITGGSCAKLEITGCVNEGTVTGGKNVGGITGPVWVCMTVTDCKNSGTVTGDTNVGGICGTMSNDLWSNDGESPTVTKCVSSGPVKGTTNVGGIAGENLDAIIIGGAETSNPAVINQCIVQTEEITGTTAVGALVGDNASGSTGADKKPGQVQSNYWDLVAGSISAIGLGAGADGDTGSAEIVKNNQAFALSASQSSITAYSGSTVTLNLAMTKPEGAEVVWTANDPAVAEIASSSDTALVLSVKSAGQATFTGTMKVGELVLKTITVDLTGQTVPSYSGGGSTDTGGTKTETTTDGSKTTETTTSTSTKADGSKVTETTQVTTDSATGAATEVKVTETVSKDGSTKTTEALKSETAADGAKTETKTTTFEDTKTGVTAQAEVVKDSAGTTAAVSAEAKAKVTQQSDGTAAATVDADTASKLIEQAKAAAEAAGAEAEDVKTTVTITADSSPSAKAVEVSIPAGAVAAAAELGAEVKVVSGAGEITLDTDAAAAVSKSAGGDDVIRLEVKQKESAELPEEVRAELGDATVVELNLYAGDEKVSQLGGNATVRIPYTTKDADKAIYLYHVADDGTKTLVPGVRLSNGTVEFKTGHFSYYAIVEGDWVNPFADVKETDWFYGAVRYADISGLFAGTSETSFSPNGSMTRAMLWTVLARIDGQDTTGGETWYAKALAWAKRTGVSDGTAPDEAITREQLAAMLWRYAGSPAAGGSLEGFTDAAEAGSYAVDALRWAVERGILSGKGGGALDPMGEATRAEAAAMLQRYLTAV